MVERRLQQLLKELGDGGQWVSVGCNLFGFNFENWRCPWKFVQLCHWNVHAKSPIYAYAKHKLEKKREYGDHVYACWWWWIFHSNCFFNFWWLRQRGYNFLQSPYWFIITEAQHQLPPDTLLDTLLCFLLLVTFCDIHHSWEQKDPASCVFCYLHWAVLGGEPGFTLKVLYFYFVYVMKE